MFSQRNIPYCEQLQNCNVKEKGKITNSDYQEINEIAERTASRDLADLVSKKILINSGLKGAGAFYTLTTNSITP